MRSTTERAKIFGGFLLISLMVSSAAWGQNAPAQTLDPDAVGLGLMPYSSDSAIPDPENGAVAKNIYRNEYFRLSYRIPADWMENVQGPPPSGTGYYVLGQFKSMPQFKAGKGTLLIAAADMFFLLEPADNTMQVVTNMKRGLSPALLVERQPAEIKIANRSFVRMDYTGAELHWSILATQIRCHTVQFLFMHRNPQVLESLIQSLSSLTLEDSVSPGSGKDTETPMCLKDYANGANVLHKVDPALVGMKFTAVPARLIIDKSGNVKHIHVLNAFPEQAKSISDALLQWKFKPYIQDGHPAEVETGILFEFKPNGVKPKTAPNHLSNSTEVSTQ